MTTRAAPPGSDGAGTFVWPPEIEALDSIEVVSLEHPPARDTVARDNFLPPRAREADERAELAPTSYIDLEDADLETLFAPPQPSGGPTLASRAGPSSPEASEPMRSSPVAETPAVVPPVDPVMPPAETTARPPSNAEAPTKRRPQSPGRWKRSTEAASALRELPEYRPSAAEVVHSSANADAPSKGGDLASGLATPAVHIEWDGSLDDDVPAMPLSGLAKGRELAEARRALAARSSAADGAAPRGDVTRVAVREPGLAPGAPMSALKRKPIRDASPRQPRAERSFGLARAGFVAAIVMLVAAGWFARETWWPPVASASRAFLAEAAPTAAGPGPPDDSGGPSSPTIPVTSDTRIAPPSAPVPVPPPERVEPDRGTAGSTPSAPGSTERAAAPAPVSQPPAAPVLQSRPAVTARDDATRSTVSERDPAIAPPPVSSGSTARRPDIGAAEATAVARNAPAEVPAPTPDPAPRQREEIPSPRPTVAPAESVPARDPEREVREALASYRAAYDSLDAGAAQRVWPTVDARALARAFSGLKSQSLRFDRCNVQVRDAAATASCEGTATFVPRVGRQDPQTEPRRWAFSLRQGAAGWRIESAETTK